MPESTPKQRIAVLFGGPSAEYDVSCSTAANIVQNLDRSQFEVTPIRVTRQAVWVVGKDDPNYPVVDVAALLAMTPDPGERSGPATLATRQTRASALAAGIEALQQVDVVIPALHGPYGEDGTVQALLDLIGVPYVGCGVAASLAGMDKVWTKILLTAAGLSVADGVVLTGEDDEPGDLIGEADRARLGLPVFVKPAREGSSIGVSKVEDWALLADAVALARRSDRKVLVEPQIRGREIDIAVLEYPDGRLVCGPPMEIRVETGIFDYAAKYQTGDSLYFPTDLDPQVTEHLHEVARTVFRTLGCAGLLRVDFFLCQDDAGGPAQLIVNEVNTFPGCTPKSQYPRIWQQAGLEFAEVLTVLVDTATAARRSA